MLVALLMYYCRGYILVATQQQGGERLLQIGKREAMANRNVLFVALKDFELVRG